jgi:N6-adenosine-specific RNA methylase IME4
MTSTWPFGSLTPMAYGAILVDPPWKYEMYSDKGHGKSPESHYATMSDESIARLPLLHLCERDCFLFMWAVWPKLDAAIQIIKQWGFIFKTGGSWTKKTVHGKNAFGTGYILRSATEPFLIGKIGAPRIGSKSIRNLIESPVREHSRKPPEMHDNIIKLTPNVRRCELFGREQRKGFDVWGNETNKFIGES